MILASASPSRKKILQDLGYSCTVQPSTFEEIFDTKISASENAIALAKGKAKEIFTKFPDQIILGMDTIAVDPKGNLLEKPKNLADARQMMRNRSGKKEIFISGLAVLGPETKIFSSESTTLTWKKFSDQEIETILATNEWQGKCGGIAIEGYTGMFISRIEGSMLNVMGVPINRFWEVGI